MFFLDIYFFKEIGIILYFLGLAGILINKRSIIISIILIEVMFYGLNISLITMSLLLDDILGQVLALFVLTIAAAESAVALSLLMGFFKLFKNIFL